MSIESVDIDQIWTDVEEPEVYVALPDGQYNAVVQIARPELTNTSNKRCLFWDLIVVDGPHEGKHIFRRNMLETPQNIGWLKSDLRKCGIDIDSPDFVPTDFLAGGTEALIGLALSVSLKTGKPNDAGQTFQNCNINGLAGVPETSDTSGAPPKSSGGMVATLDTLQKKNPWDKKK